MKSKSSQGFSLIEVLIAMLVLAVGILGAGAMQMVGLQANQGAYWRSQAVFLASDMLDRMRANRDGLANYIGTDTSTVTSSGAADCLTTANGCAAAELAAADIEQWAAYFNEANVLPDGSGVIAQVGTTYQITISWNERDWQNNGSRSMQGQTYTISADLDD